MVKPVVVKPADDVTTVGSVLGTPVVVKGVTWLPLTQFAVWLIHGLACRSRPSRPVMVEAAGDWCADHGPPFWGPNGATILPTPPRPGSWASRWMRCVFRGACRLVVYYDVNDETVTPRQHIVRALGGPVCNALLLPFALLLRRFARQGSVLGDVANAAVGMNLFLCTASLLPIPGIDGGPILKWALVERGSTPEEADELVRGVDRVVGGGWA